MKIFNNIFFAMIVSAIQSAYLISYEPMCTAQPKNMDLNKEFSTNESKMFEEKNVKPSSFSRNGPYRVHDKLKPSDLEGLSDEQIDQHWELYKGYVAQSNQLFAEISSFIASGTSQNLNCSDRRRRFGFEYNGMILHEYYFGNLKSGIKLKSDSEFLNLIVKNFGSFEKWQADFINTGKTRGIGWVILNYDPMTGTMTNNFVADHEMGNIAGFCPILVMDVWEHAYMVDYKATERGNYIDAFMQNINWNIVERRLVNAISHKLLSRFN